MFVGLWFPEVLCPRKCACWDPFHLTKIQRGGASSEALLLNALDLINFYKLPTTLYTILIKKHVPQLLNMRSFLLLVVSMLVVTECVRTVLSDEYLQESQGQCDSRKDYVSCVKYRALKYIKNYTNSSIITQETGSLRFVKIDDPEEDEEGVVSSARFFPGDLEITKAFKFIERQVYYYLNHQGILISLPAGARVIEDGEYKTGID